MARNARSRESIPKFQERLRELIGDMKYESFGAMCGISRQTVGYYVTGERVPDIVTLHSIASATGASADWLLGISDTKTSDSSIKDVCEQTHLSEDAVTRFMLWRKEMPSVTSHFIDILSSCGALSDLIGNLLSQYTLDWQSSFDSERVTGKEEPETCSVKSSSPGSVISPQDEVGVRIQKCIAALREDLHRVASAETDLAVSASPDNAKFEAGFFLHGGYSEYFEILDTERLLRGSQPSSTERLRFERYASDHEISASDKSRLESALGLKASKAGAQTEREKS